MGGSQNRVRVRAANADDAAALAGLDATAWSAESGFPSVIERNAGPFFTSDNTPADHLVCELDGTVVGYVRLKPATKLAENAHALLNAIARAKPASAKGNYVQSVSVSSTMGPGVKVDPGAARIVAAAA